KSGEFGATDVRQGGKRLPIYLARRPFAGEGECDYKAAGCSCRGHVAERVRALGWRGERLLAHHLRACVPNWRPRMQLRPKRDDERERRDLLERCGPRILAWLALALALTIRGAADARAACAALGTS